MAKAKKPATAAKGDDAENTVLEYLRKQNRPYSATDVFNNLHGAVAKTAIQKILNALNEKGEVSSKTYGKQTVYVISQDQFENPSQEDFDRMDGEIEELKKQIAEVKDQNKQLQSTLSGLNSSLTNDQIEERLKELAAENAKNEERLATLRSGAKPISQEERERINKAFETNRQLWRSRKRLFNDIWSAVTEHFPGNPKELMEEIGIEQDPVDINEDPLANI
ncbi:uncharacterized protein VTP21DRAFT_9877 [Calcarisporiella thermophila]|uniref:uncharacterized protein n=1 Tax=Calcarisporiella thermophila TaxID=911321 RepID=UPI003742B9C2